MFSSSQLAIIRRRFEYKGMFNGAEVCDDYAHHPAELAALLDTAAALDFKRVICASCACWWTAGRWIPLISSRPRRCRA